MRVDMILSQRVADPPRSHRLTNRAAFRAMISDIRPMWTPGDRQGKRVLPHFW